MGEYDDIVQTMRANNIPLRRISALQDIDTGDIENKESIQNNSYLLLSFNDGDTRINYKKKLASLLTDINDKCEELIQNNNETAGENLLNAINDLREELTQLINSKPHLSISDVQNLINAKPHLSKSDVIQIINEQPKLTIDDVRELINGLDVSNDINNILTQLDTLESQLANYYTKREIDRLYIDTNNSFNNSIRAVSDQITHALEVFAAQYLTKEEFETSLSEYSTTNAYKISSIESDISSLQSQINTTNSNLSGVSTAINNTNSNVAALQEQTNSTQVNIDSIQTTVNTVTSDMAALQEQVNSNISDIQKITNELLTNENALTTESRIDKLEAIVEDIKNHGYTPEPEIPETTTVTSYSVYFWLVDEDHKSLIINNTAINNDSSVISKSINSTNGASPSCPMVSGKKYNALNLIIDKFGLDSSLDKIDSPLYIILPANYIKYEDSNIVINNKYLKSNTLDISVSDKSTENLSMTTVKTTKVTYNKEGGRTETSTENIDISYRCLKVVNTIESGLALNY